MKSEILDKLSTLITAAFGFVAGLAWNDAISTFIKSSPLPMLGPWLYAIIITIVAVIVTVWIGKAVERAKKFEVPLIGKLNHTLFQKKK